MDRHDHAPRDTHEKRRGRCGARQGRNRSQQVEVCAREPEAHEVRTPGDVVRLEEQEGVLEHNDQSPRRPTCYASSVEISMVAFENRELT